MAPPKRVWHHQKDPFHALSDRSFTHVDPETVRFMREKLKEHWKYGGPPSGQKLRIAEFDRRDRAHHAELDNGHNRKPGSVARSVYRIDWADGAHAPEAQRGMRVVRDITGIEDGSAFSSSSEINLIVRPDGTIERNVCR